MRSFLTRTKLATGAAVVAIGITGAVAVGANVGILDTASETTTGKLSAAGDLVSPTSTLLDTAPGANLDANPDGVDRAAVGGATPATAVAPSSTLAPRGTQEFTIDEAGVLSVVGSPGAVHLDAVRPAPGWRWTMTQTEQGALSATFTNGSRTLQFDASAGSDGAIAASVTEPVLVPVPAANAATVAPTQGDPSSGGTYRPSPSASTSYDDDEHDDDDDDEHERHDDEREYEGSDDDD